MNKQFIHHLQHLQNMHKHPHVNLMEVLVDEPIEKPAGQRQTTAAERETPDPRINIAKNIQADMDWDAIQKAKEESINRMVATGRISQERANEKLKRNKEEAEQNKSNQAFDRNLKTVEKVADVAGTVANTALLFTPAAPIGIAGLAAQGGVDIYAGAMNDDPVEAQNYTNRGIDRLKWSAIGFGAGRALGAAIPAVKTGARTAAALPVVKPAVETAKRVATNAATKVNSIPGATRTLNTAQRVLNYGKGTPNNVAGGVGGGLGGIAAGASTITPEDNAITASAKVLAGAFLGQKLGSKVAGFVERQFPALGVGASRLPSVVNPATRNSTIVASQIENAPLLSQGTVTRYPRLGRDIPVTGKKYNSGIETRTAEILDKYRRPTEQTTTATYYGKPSITRVPTAQERAAARTQRDFEAQNVFDDATGTWTPKVGMFKPNPQAQDSQYPARRISGAMDYGYPNHPKSHTAFYQPNKPTTINDPMNFYKRDQPIQTYVER